MAAQPPDPHHFPLQFNAHDLLVRQLDASPELPLAENVGAKSRGIYLLYWKGKLVYVGKAMGRTTIRNRLNQHRRKIESRTGLAAEQFSCRYLRMDDDWIVRAAEDDLIKHYGPAWNTTGFGSHVPGRGRPGVRTSKWDQDFVIRTDWVPPRRRR